MADPILTLEALSSGFAADGELLRVVDRVDLMIRRGETVALVGESGCGKTALALSILRLFPTPAGRIISGRILFREADLRPLPLEALQKIRGKRISMIFQEPATFLNPVHTLGKQIGEPFRLHHGAGRAEARKKAVRIMEQVGIPDPEQRIDDYPHQLSGGLKQRVMIAMALICGPDLLIADEPTTAVDVTVQAQVLDLFKTLQRREEMAMLLITHDLNVVNEVADRIYVMYAARIVETGGAGELLGHPAHPYTRGLLDSRPALEGKRPRLVEIPGQVPDPRAFPTGCRFHPRCPRAREACRKAEPELRALGSGREVACYYPLEQEGCG